MTTEATLLALLRSAEAGVIYPKSQDPRSYACSPALIAALARVALEAEDQDARYGGLTSAARIALRDLARVIKEQQP